MPADCPPPGCLPATCLRFLDTTFIVESDDPAAVQWLGEFLGPWFHGSPEATGLTVHVRHALEAGPPAIGRATGHLPFALLDSRVLRLPGRRDGARILIEDATRHCRYTIEMPTPGARHDGALVTVHSGDRLRRIGLMRVIREIAVEHERARAHPLELHAAAFEIGGGAVLLAGAKGAGKTTLLLHAARRLGARVIANDRALVHTERAPRLTGVPSVIKVRPETTARFPELGAAAPRVDHAAQLTVEEAALALRSAGAAGTTQPLSLSAAQLARALPAALAAAAPIRAIVFQDADRTDSAPRLDRLSAAAALAGLAASLYGGPNRGAMHTVFTELVGRAIDAPAPPDTVTPADRLADLAAATPCFRLASGADPDRAVDLLAALP